MVQKMYDIAKPVPDTDIAREFQVSAWTAQGSSTINMRLRDGLGWYEFIGVWTEDLRDYAKYGIRTMDELVGYLFHVVKA